MAAGGLRRRLGAEFIGTALLLATIVGYGIMGEALAGAVLALGVARLVWPAARPEAAPAGSTAAEIVPLESPVGGAGGAGWR